MKKTNLLFYGGITAIVGGTILACVASFKAKETFDDMKEDLEDLRENKENMSEKEYNKEITKTYIYSGLKFAGYYSFPAILEFVGIAAILKAKGKYEGTITTLGAALTAEIQKNMAMSKRIKEKEGDEAEAKYRLGIEDVEITDVDEDGVETKKSVPVMNSDPKLSIYGRFFDAASREWTENPEENLAFLLHLQDIFTDRLRAKGYVFLNEVYEALDIPTTEIGQQVGWCRGYGDDYVDFRIQDIFVDARESEAKRRFVNGYENVIYLDFNVYGYIVDKVWKNGR